jgi:glycine/D-amino acid oxidase-like deaminating enzyme
VVTLDRGELPHLVKTPRGCVRAGAVLAATNGCTPPLLAHLRRRIVPAPSFIVATEPLRTNRMRSLESLERHCYYRPSPDGTRIIFGGRAAMFDAPEALAESQMRGFSPKCFPNWPLCRSPTAGAAAPA